MLPAPSYEVRIRATNAADAFRQFLDTTQPLTSDQYSHKYPEVLDLLEHVVRTKLSLDPMSEIEIEFAGAEGNREVRLSNPQQIMHLLHWMSGNGQITIKRDQVSSLIKTGKDIYALRINRQLITFGGVVIWQTGK